MNIERIKGLRRNLTLHFAVLSWLTAMLVASGSGSYFLPALIFLVSIAGFIFVDSLEWFEIGRTGNYISMAIATCLAIGGYLYSVFVSESEAGQLAAVAGLLIYPECVLFLQRKSLRVYEQLAIFLLLEMIVAALINDNLLFGILLIPIMLLWVSSLFIFSRYATLVQLEPTIDKPVPIFVELLYTTFVKPMFGESSKQKLASSSFVASSEVQSGSSLRRALQTLPIGVGAIVFAAMFFYLLPRTSPGAFRAGIGAQPTTGLPKEMRMGIFGRLLQDSTPVMRVAFNSIESGKPYKLVVPPYLRARVFDIYDGTSRSRQGTSSWRSGASRSYFPRLGSVETVRSFANGDSDLVVAEFDLRREFAASLFTIPPAFATRDEPNIPLYYDDFRMLLAGPDTNDRAIGKSLVYELGSAGFSQRTQLRITPARIPSFANRELRELLLKPVIDFKAAEPYRRSIWKGRIALRAMCIARPSATNGTLSTRAISHTA